MKKWGEAWVNPAKQELVNQPENKSFSSKKWKKPTNSSTEISDYGLQLSPYEIKGKKYIPFVPEIGYTESGIASWYGPGFHGRQTANGEIYDQNGISAAHKTLPMHTRVRVKNLSNGEELVVRINDRGPFHSGRIIDLSVGAAKRLGVFDVGIADVEIEVISLHSSIENSSVPAPKVEDDRNFISKGIDSFMVSLRNTVNNIMVDESKHTSLAQKKSTLLCKCPNPTCTGKRLSGISPKILDFWRLLEIKGLEFTVVSGLRCKLWDIKSGGKGNGAHTRGLAIDFVGTEEQMDQIVAAALHAKVPRFGRKKPTMLHVDFWKEKMDPNQLAKGMTAEFFYNKGGLVYHGLS